MKGIMETLRRVTKLQRREEYVDALRDGKRNRSQVFKSKKDYERKGKHKETYDD